MEMDLAAVGRPEELAVPKVNRRLFCWVNQSGKPRRILFRRSVGCRAFIEKKFPMRGTAKPCPKTAEEETMARKEKEERGDDMLGVPEIARKSGYSKRTIYRWIQEGKLPFPHYRTGPKKFVAKRAVVDAWLESPACKIPAGTGTRKFG